MEIQQGALCVIFLMVFSLTGPVFSAPPLNDWGTEWAFLSGRAHQPKCIDIPQNLSLCQNIGYSQMRLPNLLDHDTLSEVKQQAGSWVPLLGIQCHPDTKLFLCSLFSPVCLDRPIWPCRSLCEAVKKGCAESMLTHGFHWPEMVRCDKFPLDNDLCITTQNKKQQVDNNVCEACRQPDTFEGLIHNFCRSEFVIKVRMRKSVTKNADTKLMISKKKLKILKRDSPIDKKEFKRLSMYIENGANCKCDRLKQQQKKAENYIVMGRKIQDKLVVTYLLPWPRKSQDFKKATRAMRKSDICQSGMDVISAGMDSTSRLSKEEPARRKRNRDKNRKKSKE
ncbi:secreted frizzled-related protein 5 [Lingula anatina]|uniref:Secreted frizzled-related protein 1 n=1 Tax=Lingula anatina TaxID=7574 RepID=A0A1S3I5K5_LINAN|nr:secreted frizzled-related protein 5 [Lingula anatina]|eukprot:XP_013393537.1 secreted frizzled-related protein 5 [Lingula anatina]